LTYDDESRGLILNWFFASEDIIIGEATVSDKKGNTLLDSRVYTFNINDNSLARLDLNDFKDGSDTFFDVESVTKNLANRETSSLEKTSPYGILKWIIIGALLLVTAWMFGKDYLKRS